MTGRRALHLRSAGLSATIQDLGRPGYAHLGIGPSGALDRPQLALANRLVGNAESLAVIERVALGSPLIFVADVPLTIAVTGASGPVIVAGRPYWSHEPIRVPALAPVHAYGGADGMYSYVAVQGGLEVPALLGSRATDTLLGLGPARLVDGVTLAVGTQPRVFAAVDAAPPPAWPRTVRLRVTPGPRDDWFDSLDPLFAAGYTVTSASNRIGLRLDGPGLRRRSTAELPSEGLVAGALEVPPSGQPILLLADHPTVGGYPVAAVVLEDDLAAAAQARIGTSVSFVRV